MDQLAQRAVQAALRGDWTEAKSLNEALLEISPEDKDTLCRLARTYAELGKITKALTTYKKVLSLDPYNSIAAKAIDRLEKLKENGDTNHKNHTNGYLFSQSATSFLEEPGKTKTANLIHLGASGVLTGLSIGESVKLVPHAHRVSVETQSGDFIGRLPDDLSHRIISLSRAGNQYEVLIRAVTSNQVKIFIKELERADAVRDIPSFPATEKTDYVAFTPPELVHDERPDMGTFEEQASDN